MKKITSILLLVIFSLSVNAQITFQKTFGGINNDEANYIQQTSDGGYIIAGSSYNFVSGFNKDAYLIKTDASGNMLWNKTYGNTCDEEATCVQQTFDGGYIIGGFYHSGGINDGAVFIKTDANGNIVWFKVYAMDNWGQVKYLRQTRSGEYISLLESNKIFALKIDASGNFLWCKKYQPAGGEQAQCIQQTNDDGFVFTGNGLQPSSYSCVFLIKTDSNGISGCNEMPFLISATSPSITVQNALCPITALNIVASPLLFIYVNSSATVESTLCATFVNDKSSSPNEISIYPNPMDNFFNLEFQADGAGLSKIELYNLLGQVVLEKNFQIQQGENKLSFEISIIPAGVYLLNIQTNKSSFVKMMIKK